MTISVIIPVYNVEKYIRRCIMSIIDQKTDNFYIECIIIDDCGTDNSMNIVHEIINNYKDISVTFRIVNHNVNKGLSEARNSGIKSSTGDYIFFVDSDDAILENTFKLLLSYAKQYPTTNVIQGNSIGIEDNQLSNTSVLCNSNLCLINNKRTIIYNMLQRQIDRHAWNKLICRSFVLDNNLFFESGLLYEDVTWTYRLYSKVSSVLIVPELTYMYENNPSSIMHTHSERSNKVIWSFVCISDYLINHPPLIDGKNLFFTEHCLFVHHWMLKAIDLYGQYGADRQTSLKLKNLKQKLLWKAIIHFRPILALYFLTMFQPFCQLLKIRMYRTHLYQISRIVYKLS